MKLVDSAAQLESQEIWDFISMHSMAESTWKAISIQ